MNIKICTQCKGEGMLLTSNNFREYEHIMCENCKGSGKVYERTYTLEIPWSDRESSLFLTTDNSILTVIRKLKDDLKTKI